MQKRFFCLKTICRFKADCWPSFSDFDAAKFLTDVFGALPRLTDVSGAGRVGAARLRPDNAGRVDDGFDATTVGVGVSETDF